MPRFVIFLGQRHPHRPGAAEVSAFLNHLATERNVVPANQNQARSARLLLYREVLGLTLSWR